MKHFKNRELKKPTLDFTLIYIFIIVSFIHIAHYQQAAQSALQCEIPLK